MTLFILRTRPAGASLISAYFWDRHVPCRISHSASADVLNQEQIGQAIAYGSKCKTEDKFLDKGLKGVRVKLASAMALDGISKFATFFGDWYFIAAPGCWSEPADAKGEPVRFCPDRDASCVC